jgi:hypothetical protein
MSRLDKRIQEKLERLESPDLTAKSDDDENRLVVPMKSVVTQRYSVTVNPLVKEKSDENVKKKVGKGEFGHSTGGKGGSECVCGCDVIVTPVDDEIVPSNDESNTQNNRM